MELVGRLTASVSHDLNNLLAVVSSNLDMIEHVARSGGIEQFAAAARRAIDLSAKLTSQLLSFSRRQEIHPTRVNLNQLISEFQGLMQQALEKSATSSCGSITSFGGAASIRGYSRPHCSTSY